MVNYGEIIDESEKSLQRTLFYILVFQLTVIIYFGVPTIIYVGLLKLTENVTH